MTRPIDKIVKEVQARLAEGEDVTSIVFVSRFGGNVIDQEPQMLGGSPKARERALKKWQKANAVEKALFNAVLDEMVAENAGWSTRPREELAAEVARRMRARRKS